MFGSFLPSLWSLSNHSLLGSRSRHCYAIKWIPVRPLYGNYKAITNINQRRYHHINVQGIGFLFVVGVIIYDALTGRVSGRGGYVTRKEHPIFYWIMTPVLICVAAILLWLVLYDFYH